MPDSSLRVRLCFFFHHHSDFVSRSRMTAEVNCVSSKFSLGFCKKWQNGNRKPSPLVGEGVNRQVDGRGKLEQKRKNGKTNLTCVRTHAPIAAQCSALPSEFGGSLQLRKKEIIVFKIYYLIVAIKQ